MRIVEMVCGPLENNTYLLIEDNKALIVDAPFGSFEAAQKQLKQYNATLVAVLMTHGHWDHLGDLALMQSSGVKVYAHENSKRFIETPQVQSNYSMPGLKLVSAKIDEYVKDGEDLEIINNVIKVLHIPGHSEGSVVYCVESEKVAFVGDVIFRNSIGRTDLPGGNHQQLLDGIANKLYLLADETVLYSGHGAKTTVKFEKSTNPFVRA